MEEEKTKAVAEELQGKSKEDIEAMINDVNQELENRIINDADTYVWNVMGFDGEYSKEALDAKNKEYQKSLADKKESAYTDWDDEMFALNRKIIIDGYAIYGKSFIENVLTKDPASAMVLFETAIQLFLDSEYNLESLLDRISAATKVVSTMENSDTVEVKE